MSANKHDVENQGAKPRDQSRPRYQFLKHAHRDWRVWLVTVLMIAMMLVYVLTDNLSVRPGDPEIHSMPAANLP